MFLLSLECRRAVRLSHYVSVMLVKLAESEKDPTILYEVSDVMRGVVREIDIFGDLRRSKVGVIVWNIDGEDLGGVVGRVRRRFQYQGLHGGQGRYAGRVKIGSACFPTHSSSAEGLLRSAEGRAEDLLGLN